MTRPELSLTFAVLRWPELGFLGLVMPTFRHTPFISGRWAADSAGDTAWRGFLGDRPPALRIWFSVMDCARVVVNMRVDEEEEGLERDTAAVAVVVVV